MTRDTDLDLLTKCRRDLGIKPWELEPWEVDDGPNPYASTPRYALARSWLPAQRMRARMLKTVEGRRILTACEAAVARLRTRDETRALQQIPATNETTNEH